MAERDGATVAARRFARRFSESKGLVVPIPITDVVEDIADLDIDSFPWTIDCDGVVIERSGERPCVIINSERPPVRQRFTLAHELGHIVLPWQAGSIFCHTRITHIPSDALVRAIEADAQAFASEILIPEEWLADRVGYDAGDDRKLAAAVIELAGEAVVSVIAASLSAIRILPSESVLVLTEDGVVTYALKSPESVCNEPERGKPFDATSYTNVGAAVSSATYGAAKTRSVYVIQFDRDVASKRTGESSKEILVEILLEAGFSGTDLKTMQNRIGGIVGHANNLALRSRSATKDRLAALQSRFAGRSKLKDIVSHRRFHDYLNAKANELAKK